MITLVIISYILALSLTYPIECIPINNGNNLEFKITAGHLNGIPIPNKESGKKVEQWKPESKVNPEELGEYLEGDIISIPKLAKNGLLAETTRWPKGTIPFEINGHFSTKERGIIGKAMDEFHKNTCVRFRRREPSDVDWISITNTFTGCWSSVGRIGGLQEVNLQSTSCFGQLGTTIHELLHVAGFQHEQNRWERDSYVTVILDNVQRGKEINFQKSGKDTVTGFGIPYDYGSLLHYSEMAFSRNDKPTIVVKKPGAKVGQRQKFSQGDIDKVRLMYNCPSTNQIVPPVVIDSGNSENNNGNSIGEIVSILFPHL